ncbi:MAG: hypothetical protein WCG38_19890 [Aestuariivirga sp.]
MTKPNLFDDAGEQHMREDRNKLLNAADDAAEDARLLWSKQIPKRLDPRALAQPASQGIRRPRLIFRQKMNVKSPLLA